MQGSAPQQIHYLRVQITGFVCDDPRLGGLRIPGCRRTTAHLEEKEPVVSAECLYEKSTSRNRRHRMYVLGGWEEPDGRHLVRMDAELPWGIESSEGVSRFRYWRPKFGRSRRALAEDCVVPLYFFQIFSKASARCG